MNPRDVVADWWRTVTDVRRDELAPAGLMFLYGLLALGSHYVLKPVRNSVVVDRLGADSLPWIYVLTALAVSGVALLYSRWSEDTPPRRLLPATFVVLGVTLVVFWAWLRVGGGVAPVAFYLFGKIYPLLLLSQFWLVASLVFTTRQAKRLFGPVGGGLVVGGVAGSAVAGLAADAIGTEALLLVAAGLLAACSAAVRPLMPRLDGDRGDTDDGGPSAGALELVRTSSHLRAVALVLGLTVVVSTLVDWQFNRAVELFVAGEDAKTAFYGKFFALQNAAAVGVQLLFTSWVLRRLGIGVALVALPAALLVATAGVFAVPGLLAVAVAKGTDGGLRYSLDQATRELLFLPVPSAVKYRAKPVIDLGVRRGGTGLAGLILLAATHWIGLGIRGVAILAAVLLAVWLLATVRMRSEFRQSVRRLIGVRDVDLDELVVEQLDADTLGELRRALRSDQEETVLYALALLEQSPGPELEGPLRELLHHASSRVRARTLELLYDLGVEEAADEAERLLRDESRDVRTEAVHFVCDFGRDDPAEKMEALLDDEDPDVRSAAVGCLLRHGGPEQRERALQEVRALARSESADDRADAASLLAEAREASPGTEEVLGTLVRDREASVRRAAMRTAGRIDARRLAPELVRGLGDPETLDAARSGLEGLCPDVHGELARRLPDGSLPARVRERLARVLYVGATQESVDHLRAALDAVDERGVRFQVLRTLDKIRRDRDDLSFGHLDIEAPVRREVREAYQWAVLRIAVARGDADGRRAPDTAAGVGDGLLDRLLVQREREAVERALRTLGLRYPPGDLYVAFTALTSDDELDRERGLELLENVLPLRYRRLLAPLVDPDGDRRGVLRTARGRFDLREPKAAEALEELAGHADPWVRSLACLHAGETEEAVRSCGRGLRLEDPDLLGVVGARADEPIDLTEEDFVEIVDRADLLRETELFADLRTEALAGLATLVGERTFDEGEEVFSAGELSTELYVVGEGAIEARQDGRTAFVARRGEAVGGLSLLDGKARHYTAVAVERTRALSLDRQDFFRVMEEEFDVVEAVVAHLADEVRRAGADA